MSTTAPDKASLRLALRSALAALTPADRRNHAAMACRRLVASRWFGAARLIMVYSPMRHELDPAPLAIDASRQGKAICLPRADWTNHVLDPRLIGAWGEGLVMGRFDIPEPGADAPPVDHRAIDLVIVPGLAFDERCFRLGQGAGFYDRFVTRPGLKAAKVGLCFDEQVVPAVPIEAWDAPLDAVITPTRTILASGASLTN